MPMPMPKPKKNEERNDFVSRCIEKVTTEERDKFPSNEQRAAICYSQWRRSGGTDDYDPADSKKSGTKKSSGSDSRKKSDS